MTETKIKPVPVTESKICLPIRLLWIISIAVLLCSYFIGFCYVDGDLLNPFSAIDGVFNLFSMKGAMWYYYVGTCACCVFYFVFAVKNVLYLKDAIPTLKQKGKVAGRYAQGTLSILLRNCLTFYAISGILYETKMSVFGIIACAVSAVVIVVNKALVLKADFQNSSMKNICIHCAPAVAESVIVTFLCIYAITPVTQNIISSLSSIFSYIDLSSASGWFNIYNGLGKNIVNIFIAIHTVIFIRACIDESGYKTDLRKKLLRICLTAFAIDLVVYIFFVMRVSELEVIDQITSYIRYSGQGALTYALLGLAAFTLNYFPTLPTAPITMYGKVIGQHAQSNAAETNNETTPPKAADESNGCNDTHINN